MLRPKSPNAIVAAVGLADARQMLLVLPQFGLEAFVLLYGPCSHPQQVKFGVNVGFVIINRRVYNFNLKHGSVSFTVLLLW
jgi:hypothetical protein